MLNIVHFEYESRKIRDGQRKIMKEIKLDIKFVGTIVTFICTMVGFYYSTSYRLDSLEAKIETLDKNNEAVIRLEERLKNVQTKTDEIYNYILSLSND
jgi:hypothetical protein